MNDSNRNIVAVEAARVAAGVRFYRLPHTKADLADRKK